MKPTILFTFNNGGYDNRVELLNQYGFKGTFNIDNTEGVVVAGSSKFNEIKNLVKDGHDIGIYSGKGTQPTTYTSSGDYDLWYTYIKDALDVMHQLGIYYPTQYGCIGLKGSKYIFEICEKLGFKYISCSVKWVNTDSN